MRIKGRSPYLAVDRFARMGLVWQLLTVIVGIVVLMAAVAFIGGIFDPYDWFLIGANPGDPGTLGGRIASVFLYALFSIGFTGLFITYIINWMDRRRERWECGSARYNITDGFALVIGGHSMTPKLCARLLSDSANRYVVVTTEGDADTLRRMIYSELPEPIRHRLIVYHVSQTSDIDLRQLNSDKANVVYILGDDGNPTPDADNMDTYRRLIAICGRRGETAGIPCHVLLGGVSACRVLYACDVESRADSPFDFLPLFLYDEWARRILTGDGVRYPGVTGSAGIRPESDKRVHVVILGVSDMSMAVMRQAAQLLHFSNYVAGAAAKATRITVIDRDMQEWLPRLRNIYPQLFDALPWQEEGERMRKASVLPGITDIEWTFIDADPDSCDTRAIILGESSDPDEIVTVVISDRDGDSASASVSFNLSPDIYERDNVVQVLVHQQGSSALVDEVAKGISWTGDDGIHYTPSRFAKFIPFGMSAESDCMSDFDAVEPKIIAYAYRNMDKDPQLEQLLAQVAGGDCSALENVWQSISTDGGKSVMSKRMSNIYSAASVPFKAGWIDADGTLTDSQVELLAEVEHLRWNMEQLLSGYRPVTGAENEGLVSGRICRADLKSRFIHPDIVPYGQLSEGSRNYDRAIVRCLPNFIKICNIYNEKRIYS